MLSYMVRISKLLTEHQEQAKESLKLQQQQDKIMQRAEEQDDKGSNFISDE